MSSLKHIEREQFEKTLDMSNGYVLNFSDRSFAEFFFDFGVNICAGKYLQHGTSKANRLRTFWKLEPDDLVGEVMESMLEASLTHHDPSVAADPNFQSSQAIVNRLLGKTKQNVQEETEQEFLKREFGEVSLAKLKINPSLLKVLEKRLEEANKCLKFDIPLACIFSLGSFLEGILLETASQSPQKFNQSKCCPKDKTGSPKSFPNWVLSELIDVSHDVGSLKADVKKFSHHLRDFRNFIHPHHQMISDFFPDIYTAKICFQVIKAAVADLSGER